MIKLDDDLLVELGLAALPPEDKKRMLTHIYETLEMRVGMELAKQMSDAQLNEFEQFINRNDEAGALKWLETNFPNYKEVVAAEFEKLKAEIKQVAPQILQDAAAAAAQAPQQMPGAPAHMGMPGQSPHQPMPAYQGQPMPYQQQPMQQYQQPYPQGQPMMPPQGPQHSQPQYAPGYAPQAPNPQVPQYQMPPQQYQPQPAATVPGGQPAAQPSHMAGPGQPQQQYAAPQSQQPAPQPAQQPGPQSQQPQSQDNTVAQDEQREAPTV